MIKIVDYGLGNVSAFLNAYRRNNIPVTAARSPDELLEATKIILPGVGAFDHAMERLQASGLRQTLERMVFNRRVPVLGVCVGMQMLGHSSEEGRLPGLGWIDGRVRSFAELKRPDLLLPHMGWNDVQAQPEGGLFNLLRSDARFYFLHSYFFECAHQRDVAAVAMYGADFCCAVSSGHIHGVQFHPEKSHHFGMQLLKNFAEL